MSAVAIFNQWRQQYAVLTDAEHATFYDEVARQYPDQYHADQRLVTQFFNTLPLQSPTVLELGGWSGALADVILKHNKNIVVWRNLEISRLATTYTICHDPRYAVEVPTSFRWWRTYDCTSFDVFVAAHVLEHLSWPDVQEVLHKFSHCRAMCIEMPLFHYFTTLWNDTESSHILDVSWRTVRRYIESLGFRADQFSTTVTCFYNQREG